MKGNDRNMTIFEYFRKTQEAEEKAKKALNENINNNTTALRKFFQSHEFDQKLQTMTPYFIGSLVTWPIYWLYRGFEWPSRRGREALPVYIRKTFFQAKMLQLLIISAGIIAATYPDPGTRFQKVFDFKEA